MPCVQSTASGTRKLRVQGVAARDTGPRDSVCAGRPLAYAHAN